MMGRCSPYHRKQGNCERRQCPPPIPKPTATPPAAAARSTGMVTRIASPAAPELARDPVCGMSVDPASAKPRAEYGGATLLFLLRRVPRKIPRRAAALSRRNGRGCRQVTTMPPLVPTPTAINRRGRARDGQGPGLRHERRSRRPPSTASIYAGQTYYFCSGRLPRQVRRRAAALSRRSAGRSAVAGRRGRRSTPARCIPKIRQVGPGSLSDLRHGARAGDAGRRDRAQSRARRHDAAVLDRPSALAIPVAVLDMVAPMTSLGATLGASGAELDPARPGDAGGAVGGLAVLRRAARSRSSRATSTCSR